MKNKKTILSLFIIASIMVFTGSILKVLHIGISNIFLLSGLLIGVILLYFLIRLFLYKYEN